MELFCLGELLVDMMPAESEDTYQMHVGGAAGNVAVAAAQLGVRSCALSKVGDDLVGRKILAELKRRNVDTSGVCIDPLRRSTLVLVSLDENKVPEYLFYRENAATLSYRTEDLPVDLLSQGKALYFSSIFLTDPSLRRANYGVVEAAKACGLKIFFDVNIRLSLWSTAEEARNEVLNMVQHVDVLKVNDEELAFLFGEGDISATVKAVMNRYANLDMVAVTLGADGAHLFTRESSALVPAHATDVVNTSGAGDAFFGSIIYWCLKLGATPESSDLEKIGRFANAAAYLTACKPGAMQALPTLEEVEALVGRE